jgi:hypothetical protein
MKKALSDKKNTSSMLKSHDMAVKPWNIVSKVSGYEVQGIFLQNELTETRYTSLL